MSDKREVTITRKRGSFHDLVFSVDLSAYNKTASDIADIIFVVKANAAQPDNAAMLTKRMSTGGIVFADPLVKVKWGKNEYSNMDMNTIYTAGVFIKWAGDDSFDENVDVQFKLKIDPDLVRE